MDGRERGRINLHRRILSSPDMTGLKGQHRHVFTVLLLLANWKPGTFYHGNIRVDVGRGELAYSLESISRYAAVSVREARTAIAAFMKRGVISSRVVKNDTGFATNLRVLTVLNYDHYQAMPADSDTSSDMEATRTRHGGDMEATLIEEGKEGKKEKKPSPVAVAPGRHSALMALLVSAYRDLRSDKYPHGGAKDAVAVKRLMGWSDDDAEIVRRFRAALDSSDKFYRAESIAQFATSERWGHFGSAPKTYSAVGGVGDFSRKEANEF